MDFILQEKIVIGTETFCVGQERVTESVFVNEGEKASQRAQTKFNLFVHML